MTKGYRGLGYHTLRWLVLRRALFPGLLYLFVALVSLETNSVIVCLPSRQHLNWLKYAGSQPA